VEKRISRRGSRGLLRMSPKSHLLEIALLVAGAIVLFLVFKRKATVVTPATTYENCEEWDITYNTDGLPTKVVVHREAAQGG